MQMRYLDGGILAAKAACRVFSLGEGEVVEEDWLRTLGEVKDWGQGDGTVTGVLGGTEGPAELGEAPGELNPL